MHYIIYINKFNSNFDLCQVEQIKVNKKNIYHMYIYKSLDIHIIWFNKKYINTYIIKKNVLR